MSDFMPEDFGWSGDETLIGDCQDDWRMDLLDMRGDDYEAEMHAREELALEFADEKGEGSCYDDFLMARVDEEHTLEMADEAIEEDGWDAFGVANERELLAGQMATDYDYDHGDDWGQELDMASPTSSFLDTEDWEGVDEDDDVDDWLDDGGGW